METDLKIQKIIRQEFKESTLISITHRLHSITDYDRVVVMDEGKIIECGIPKELLDRKDGLFAKTR